MIELALLIIAIAVAPFIIVTGFHILWLIVSLPFRIIWWCVDPTE